MNAKLPFSGASPRDPAIDIARLICIFCVVYVHGGTGHPMEITRALPFRDSYAYWILVEGLGRSSVPLLSIISGWLVAEPGKRLSIGRKASSLLAPMASWNLLAVFLAGLATLTIGFDAGFVPVGMPLFNEIGHLTEPAVINVQNPFLRDVFVCMVAAPVFLRLQNRTLWLALAGVAIWAVMGWELLILLRPQILLFFLLGILTRRLALDGRATAVPTLPLALVFLSLAATKVALAASGNDYETSHPEMIALFDNVFRLVAAIAFWKVARWLADSRLSSWLVRLSAYSFLLFCSHTLVIRALGPLEKRLVGVMGDPYWPAFFLVQPVVALAIAVMIGKGLSLVFPNLLRMLNGGRPLNERRPQGTPSSIPA